MWFTESGANSIGRIPITATSNSPGIREYTLPGAIESPLSIVAANDRAMWFSNSVGPVSQNVGRIAIGSGKVLQGGVSSVDAAIGGIAVGPDGALWYTDTGNGAIGRVTIDGATNEIPVSTQGGGPVGIATGPDGAIWFTSSYYVGRLR
jgi:virginiamycin B lyase